MTAVAQNKLTLKSVAILVVAALGYLALDHFGLLPTKEKGAAGPDGGAVAAETRHERPAPPRETPAESKRSEETRSPAPETDPGALDANEEGLAKVRAAFANRRSEVMATITGTVKFTLPDDEDGSRHQRFVLDLGEGLTVLVAHNIDLAPRVPLDEGDRIELHGQYEWNEKGGVMHWTHHDPAGWHEGGWIRHDGRKYE